MLRALLAERFGMKVVTIRIDIAAFVQTAGEGG